MKCLWWRFNVISPIHVYSNLFNPIYLEKTNPNSKYGQKSTILANVGPKMSFLGLKKQCLGCLWWKFNVISPIHVFSNLLKPLDLENVNPNSKYGIKSTILTYLCPKLSFLGLKKQCSWWWFLLYHPSMSTVTYWNHCTLKFNSKLQIWAQKCIFNHFFVMLIFCPL